jgi:hypothetical protein
LRGRLKAVIHLPFNAAASRPFDKGEWMRRMILGAMAVAAMSAATPISAATIVIFTNPMTMERHAVVVDPDGPDRAFLCMLPPGTSGCVPIKVERQH